MKNVTDFILSKADDTDEFIINALTYDNKLNMKL